MTLAGLVRMPLAVLALALAGAAVPAAPAAPGAAPPKPSALAPHHTGRRAFGAPIAPPILHRRHKHPRVRSPATPVPASSRRPAPSSG